MQKILVVINSLSVGGAERLVVDQVNYLEKFGYEVDVLTLLLSNKPGFYNDLKFSKGKLLHILAPTFSLKSVCLVRGIIKQGHYDVVISHLFLANTLARLAGIFVYPKLKIITYEHNTYFSEKRFKHYFIDLVLSLFTQKIIAVSDLVKEYLIKKGISPKKIIVVQNGVSKDFINKIIPAQKIRQDLGFSEKEILVVSSGNVNPQKGYEILIEAATQAIKKYPNIHFLICGSAIGIYADSLKKLIIEKQIDKNFHFLGSRLDAVSIVNCADMFVMPSLWEGLSISLLESLLLGKIIIVSKIPSLTSLIENNYNGLIFDVDDTEYLAKLIIDIATNPSDYRALAENAKIVGGRYSIDLNVEKILNIINS